MYIYKYIYIFFLLSPYVKHSSSIGVYLIIIIVIIIIKCYIIKIHNNNNSVSNTIMSDNLVHLYI